MRYAKLVETLEDIAGTVAPAASFVHGSKADGTMEFSGAFPQIHLYYPVKDKPKIEDGRWSRNWAFVLAFWDKDTADSTPEQRMELLDRMEALCVKYVTEMNEREISITDIEIVPQIRTLTALVSGCAVSIQINSMTNTCDE